MRSIRHPNFVLGCAVALLAISLGPSVSLAEIKFKPARPDRPDRGDLNLPLLPSDRTLSRGIRKAEQRILEGEYSQAIRFLDDVLRHDQEDYFVDVGTSGEHLGLKETARRMIRQLPTGGRELYQATYGPVARRELERAKTAGDEEAIRSIAFRYIHTEAGVEAALLLAQSQSDLGRHLSAALIYEELLAAMSANDRNVPQLLILAASAWRAVGEPSKAEANLTKLFQSGHRSVRIAGDDLRVAQLPRDPLQWLDNKLGPMSEDMLQPRSEWLTARGDSQRNAHVQGGLPHMRERWAVRLLDHPTLEEHHDAIAADKLRQKKALAVAAAPLAVGDYVITRSAHNLVAVDYKTGKRVWRSQPQRVAAFENLSAEDSVLTDATRESPARKLNQRVWNDGLYSSISSDGQRVFVIRDLTVSQNVEVDLFGGIAPGGRNLAGYQTGGTNRLCAYELASEGKLVWEIDGASAKSELAGAFFLGAPLWVGQSLYGLAEIKSAVYLVALDRRSGALHWKQQLVGLEASILLDGNRRMFAAVPSYDSGILVCTTGAGVVVGVDLSKRSLAWAYRYEKHPSSVVNVRGRTRLPTVESRHWTDPATIIANGKVIVTPPDSNEIHCLDLLSGKLIWSRNRGEALWVAGVHGDRLLLVSNKVITALRLSDGKSAWDGEVFRLEADRVPSGRGFFSEGNYYLPLSSAEVLAIDMADGNLVAKAASRDGRVLGNLICYRGAVLSQTGRTLDCFDLVEVLRTNSENALLANKNDVDALRVLGEIAYNEGELALAIDYLQRSLAGEGESLRTKEVLMECLAVALEEDFTLYQEQLPLLRELHASVGSSQQNLLRIEAQGLFETGDLEGAAEACLRLFAELGDTNQLLEVRRDYQTSMSRWLRCQMGMIWKESSAAQRRDIVPALLAYYKKAVEGTTIGEMDRFAECFGSLQSSEPALLQIAEENLAVGEALAAQQIYLSLTDSVIGSTRAHSLARCSQMLHERGLGQLANSFDQELSGPYAEEVCLENMTGKECLSKWKTKPTLLERNWPLGKVNTSSVATKSKAATKRIRTPQTRIRFERTDDVLGRSSVLTTNRTRGDIEVLDSLGNQIFRAQNEEQPRLRIYPDGSNYAVSRGNLLVISHGTEIVAYDTLSSSGVESDKVLWNVSVTQGMSYDRRVFYGGVARGHDRHRFAPSKPFRAQDESRWIGVLGPLTRDSFVYQDQRRLVCVEPVTGKVKWWRSDVPLGCDLYGDDDYLFAVPRNSREALVFSTLDGRNLGRVEVPSWQEQLVTVGRNFVRWKKLSTGQQELSSIDSLHGEVLWKMTFQRGARVDIAQGRYIAVVETDGDCKIIDATDGTLLVDSTFERSSVLKEAYLLAGADSFVVVRQQPASSAGERNVRPLNPLDYLVMDGSLMAFDRQNGSPLWNKPVEVNHESFILSQPVDLPVLAFAGTVSERNKSGARPATSMVVLEKSTGRMLYEDDKLLQAAGNYCRVKLADPEKPVVEVEMVSRTVHLEFTDQPRPPEPVATVGGSNKRKKESSGLLGIGLKLMGQD